MGAPSTAWRQSILTLRRSFEREREAYFEQFHRSLDFLFIRHVGGNNPRIDQQLDYLGALNSGNQRKPRGIVGGSQFALLSGQGNSETGETVRLFHTAYHDAAADAGSPQDSKRLTEIASGFILRLSDVAEKSTACLPFVRPEIRAPFAARLPARQSPFLWWICLLETAWNSPPGCLLDAKRMLVVPDLSMEFEISNADMLRATQLAMLARGSSDAVTDFFQEMPNCFWSRLEDVHQLSMFFIDYLLSDLDDRPDRPFSGENANSPPALPQQESAAPKPPDQHPDGPVEPGGFRWKGVEYPGLTGKAFLLVKFLWTCRGRTASFSDLAQPVWGDRNESVETGMVGSLRTRINTFMTKASLPFRVALAGGLNGDPVVILKEMPHQ